MNLVKGDEAIAQTPVKLTVAPKPKSVAPKATAKPPQAASATTETRGSVLTRAMLNPKERAAFDKLRSEGVSSKDAYDAIADVRKRGGQ
jgi:hypothetical protein